MAEQVSHNVVDNPESMSASALIDVDASKVEPVSAANGADQITYTKTDTTQIQDAPASEHDRTNKRETQSTLSVAEPSAGGATDGVAAALTDLADSASGEKSFPDSIHTDPNLQELPDGIVDDVTADERSVDLSLNSDTEGSRGDASEKKDGQHTRTSSVKKPTTFSKVSVTKNFLAKSATATGPVVKLGDKPSPSGTPLQAMVRPRLIAKTGASLRDVQKIRQGTEPASGPDASKVWNKNQRKPMQSLIAILHKLTPA